MATRTTSDIANDIQASLITAWVCLVDAAQKYEMADEDRDRIQGLIDEALRHSQELKGPLPKAAGGCSTSVRV